MTDVRIKVDGKTSLHIYKNAYGVFITATYVSQSEDEGLMSADTVRLELKNDVLTFVNFAHSHG